MITSAPELTLEDPLEAAAPPLRLGDRLLRAGILTEAEIESALLEQSNNNLRLGETLLMMGFLDEEELLPHMEQQLDVSAVRLRDGIIDPEAVRMLPKSKAEAIKAIVLFKVRETVTVAMADPNDLQQIDEIERLTGCVVRPVFALQLSLEAMLERCYEADFSVDAVTADLDADAIEIQEDMIDIDLQSIDSMTDGSPIVSLVNYIIVHAVRQGASDIHIEPGMKYTLVRYRVDGQLREVLRPRKDFHPAIVSRLKVMGKMDIAERRMPQDGRMHISVEGRTIDFRISTLPTVLGEKIVLRILDRENLTFNLEELGVPTDQLHTMKQMISKPYGLVLVTGPTGSGKTTTLYSAIELMKSVHRNIVTVEDPVEYQLELINQVQASANSSMSFQSVLRSILRQDPDVMMIGEIRDAETAEIAIQAALTGHLVMSTLHTNDSASAVTRLLDMGIAPYKISSSLVGVVAQRLMRKVCPHCQIQYYPPADLLEMIHYEGDKRRQFVHGEGCKKCYDTGHLGRVGIYEVMQCTPKLREMISTAPKLDDIRKCHKEQGGTFLLDEGIKRAEEGQTSIDEVVSVAFFE